MKVLKLFGSAVLLTCLLAAMCRADEDKELNQDVQSAIESFNKADSSMKKLFDKAAGYVVFPSVGKGGSLAGGVIPNVTNERLRYGRVQPLHLF